MYVLNVIKAHWVARANSVRSINMQSQKKRFGINRTLVKAAMGLNHSMAGLGPFDAAGGSSRPEQCVFDGFAGKAGGETTQYFILREEKLWKDYV